MVLLHFSCVHTSQFTQIISVACKAIVVTNNEPTKGQFEPCHTNFAKFVICHPDPHVIDSCGSYMSLRYGCHISNFANIGWHGSNKPIIICYVPPVRGERSRSQLHCCYRPFSSLPEKDGGHSVSDTIHYLVNLS